MKFAEGMYFDRRENAPDFVIGNISIQRDKFISWLKEQDTSEKGYVNLDVKRSRNGKPYVSLNEWKPKESLPPGAENPDDWKKDDEVPF